MSCILALAGSCKLLAKLFFPIDPKYAILPTVNRHLNSIFTGQAATVSTHLKGSLGVENLNKGVEI